MSQFVLTRLRQRHILSALIGRQLFETSNAGLSKMLLLIFLGVADDEASKADGLGIESQKVPTSRQFRSFTIVAEWLCT